MSLPGGLLKILDNEAEPLNKRLKLADNAFKAQEIHARHKEALLLNWILNKSASIPDEELLSLGNQWVLSREFRELNQNDITNENISSIIELIQNKLTDIKLLSANNLQKVTNLILSLCENQVFQQYFKYNLESYCNLIAVALEAIAFPGDYVAFISKPFLFPKHLIVQENFLKQFLDSIFSVLVEKVLMFNNDPQVVNETVQIIQKCLLQGNIKHFQNFFDNIFAQDEANGITAMSKPVFKRLFAFLQEDSAVAKTTLSLFFAAFSASFKDALLIFKCFIYLFACLQFDVSNSFAIKIPFKQKQSLPLSKSMDILLGLLNALGSNNFTDCTFSNISFTEFLRNILKTLITIKPQNTSALEIILSCIAINPLIIEPLASGLTTFVMLANRNSTEIYEKVVIAIFEVFAKLHRAENFIAKIIPALKNAIIGQKSESYEETCNFGGILDLQVSLEVATNEIFTRNILACFTKCLNSLASWQSINIFATITYHLKAAIEEYSSNENNDTNKFIFMEILGVLMGCFLQSIKIADHSIPLNVVAKFVKGLEELREILKNFGSAILKTEHNHVAMRTFLNLSYVWAEVYITLTYYSMNKEVQITTVMDNTYSAANLKYLHSYMDIKQWQLIAQRISNFGEYPCKKLLQKLYIQKLRSILLFEKQINDDIVINIVKTLQAHLDDTWRDLLLDKFTVNFLVPKMDKASLTFLAEHLIEEDTLNHILDSSTLTKATVYALLTKINKLLKGKRKHNGEQNASLSSKIFSIYPEEIFFDGEDLKITNLEEITNLYNGWDVQNATTIINKEDKLQNYINILKKVPFIYSNVNIQKLVLLYFMSLNVDIVNCSEGTRTLLEDLIIGTLRACKFPLTEIFNIKVLGTQILNNFYKHELLFGLLIDNVFKCEKSITEFEPLVLYLTKHLQNAKHLNSSISVLQAINKIKKSKIDQSAKEKLNQYKDTILTKMSKFVCKSEYSVEAYATCLKHYISLENSSETLKQLLNKLDSYLNYALENISNENKHGCALLFTAILQNKTKIKSADIVLRIWSACKKVDIGEEDCQLVRLIVTLIANEEFETLVKDLFDNTDASIKSQNQQHLVRQLKNWESILTVDVNPVKMKIWQDVLENLVYELLHILKTHQYDEPLFKCIVQLKQSIIQTQHFILSPPLIDMFIMTPQVLMKHEHKHFEQVFSMSISTLEMLLKYRNATIMDRLPAFLQQYRILLKSITDYSNSDSSEKKLDPKTASDCVHTLEKLTKNLVWCKKDMGRIAVFLIADILQTYERINLYPNVKLHLNNCVYSLISLCDHHAISYLMRALSNASTEMFKIMYDHYKKYYMFTGKV